MESLPNQQNKDQEMESMGPELPPEVEVVAGLAK